MVTRLIFLFLFMPFFLCSGEFTASVTQNQVNLGESLTLNLTLKEASARGLPSIGFLRQSFHIQSQQQASNTVVVNGKATSSTTWKLVLIPQQEGDSIISAISIDTSEGILLSEPITIHVAKGVIPKDSELFGVEGVTLTSEINNSNPYKNEPILYTVKLSSKRSIANIQLNKVEVEDSIVEPNGEPKIQEKVINGMRVDVVEFSYLITPLKAGSLKIPPAILHGGIPIKRKVHGGSIFDSNFDPIAAIQGFDRLEPFELKAKEIVLDVQPAVVGVNPWLPLRSLQIEETFDESQSLQQGEPFSRSFKITAEGIKSGQLPSLNDLQINDNLFKIYADNPELGDEIKNGRVTSYRKEQYTLIPQESGSLTLPEISIAFWDVLKKEKSFATVPAKTLQILPAPASVLHRAEPNTQEILVASSSQAVVVQRDPVLYAVIAGLTLLLIAAVFFGISLQKKVLRLKGIPKDTKKAVKEKKPKKQFKFNLIKKPPKSDKKEKLPDLNPT